MARRFNADNEPNRQAHLYVPCCGATSSTPYLFVATPTACLWSCSPSFHSCTSPRRQRTFSAPLELPNSVSPYFHAYVIASHPPARHTYMTQRQYTCNAPPDFQTSRPPCPRDCTHAAQVWSSRAPHCTAFTSARLQRASKTPELHAFVPPPRLHTSIPPNLHTCSSPPGPVASRFHIAALQLIASPLELHTFGFHIYTPAARR